MNRKTDVMPDTGVNDSFRYWRTDPRRIHVSTVRKARKLLRQYRQGKRVYSELGCSGYLKIDVGVRWRLLSKNRGEDWLFMSHQTYDREMKQ
jgi:ribosomal protein L19E